MGAEEFIRNQKEILDRLEKLEGKFGMQSTLISRLGIDSQRYVRANDPVVPGIACKLAFDQNGLILKGEQLSPSDIPQLPIDKIQGLRDILNRKEEKSSQKEVSATPQKERDLRGIAIKVAYDTEGRILCPLDLFPMDIPQLPIDKITGLEDRLKILEDRHEENEDKGEFKTTPGTFPKVTFDSLGRVTKGERLSLNDIPTELLSRLNILESNLTSYAPRSLLDSLQESLMKKVDANNYMTPGTYMKVQVDSKGFVVGHEKVTKKDLPEILMSDVEGLESILRKKADQSTLIGIQETVAKLSSIGSKLSDVSSIKAELTRKATKEEVTQIANQLSSTNTLVQNLIDKIPNDTIIGLLNQIQGEVSAISGRVAVLERKLSEK